MFCDELGQQRARLETQFSGGCFGLNWDVAMQQILELEILEEPGAIVVTFGGVLNQRTQAEMTKGVR